MMTMTIHLYYYYKSITTCQQSADARKKSTAGLGDPPRHLHDIQGYLLGVNSREHLFGQLIQKKQESQNKNIQQQGFACGHPPYY